MIDFKLESITPGDALRILNEHDDAVKAGDITNRGRKLSAIHRYSTDLKADRWFPETGETLKFQTADQILRGRNLIDGQNRLAACVDADVVIRVYVARGVAREAFSYIDGGEKRTLRDILRISREKDPGHLSAALTCFAQWDHATGRWMNGPVSTQRALNLLGADPAIRKSVERAKVLQTEERLLQVGTGAFLHRVFSDFDRELADAFLSAVAVGDRLDQGDPFLELRRLLVFNRGQKRKYSRVHMLALAIKAWNAKRNDRAMKHGSLTFKKGEAFPILEPAAHDEAAPLFPPPDDAEATPVTA